MTAAVVFYAIAMALAAFEQDEFAPSLVVAAFTLFFWLMGWNSAIRFTATRLSLTNVLVTSTVAWKDVAGVTADDGLSIRLRDGRILRSIAFGGSLIGAFTKYPTHQRARRILSEAHRDALRDGSGAGPVRLHASLDWRRPLVAAAVLSIPLLVIRAVSG
ncbi:hypothetical protein HHL19_32135 [Streptomyces sp. R302]|uniref:hypothetical protein n=1 Tax=unclassified Streptomyces TaxID=2593676 RepID=UPI00145F5D03|nr:MULTISPECIES: hypothetical protein [unclassified Streptomyces]NML53920.1 hypothetical protein [Streptomyces sp. R301]NML83179.1 hypothetical protein [Streptomyces sp. R302]